MNQDNARALPVGADVEKVVKGTNLIDGDLLAWLLFALAFSFGLPFFVFLGQGVGLQETEIRVIALRQPRAGGALTAGRSLLGGNALAQQ